MIRLFPGSQILGKTQKWKTRENLAGQAFLFFFMFFLNSADPTISEPGTGSACYNRVPRSLFPGFGGGRPICKAREKRPGDEVVLAMQTMSHNYRSGERRGVLDQYLGIGEPLRVWTLTLVRKKKILRYTPCSDRLTRNYKSCLGQITLTRNCILCLGQRGRNHTRSSGSFPYRPLTGSTLPPPPPPDYRCIRFIHRLQWPRGVRDLT